MYSFALFARMRRFHAPVGMLVVLLQRTPVLRLALPGAEYALSSTVGQVLKGAIGLAAMGAYNALAGATTFTVVSSTGTATGGAKSTFQIAGTAGTPINGATGITFSVSGAPGTPKSFGVTNNANGTNYSNTLPPGLAVNPITGTTSGGAPYYDTNLKLTITGTPTTAGTYTVRFWASDSKAIAGGNSAYVIANFTIAGGVSNIAPSITTQPTSQSVTAGSPVSFTVGASGSPAPTYQWQKDSVAIAGATSATYTIASTVAGDAGGYTAVATNSAGNATSSSATLTVNPAPIAPTVTTQPQSSTVAVGTAASFSVVASGTGPLSYQWKKGGSAIAGATSATYSIASSQSGDAGNYSVAVSNVAGSVNSSAATLTVNPALQSPSISSEPQSITVIPGSGATFSVAAGGTAPLTYQWQKGGVNVIGATSATFTIASAVAGDAGNYTVIVTNGVGNVTSSTAVLTVSAVVVAPSITTQPASAAVTAGTAASFSVVANGTAPLTYQWKKGSAAIAGATSASFQIASAQASDAGDFTVVVTNAGGAATSAIATLTVSAVASAPTITSQPQNLTVTAGSSASFSVTVGGTAPFTYQWQKENVAIASAAASTITIASAQSGDAGNYTVLVTNAAGSVTSSVATLTVNGSGTGGGNSAPVFSAQPVSQTVAPGHTVSFAASAGGSPAPAYLWQLSTNGGTSWSNLSDTTMYAGITSTTLTLNNATLTMNGYGYRLTASNSAGSANSNAITLTVTTPAIPGPNGLTIDSSGKLYLSDSSNNTIQVITTAGVATVLAGSAGQQGANDGSAGAALFRQPGGVVLDLSGNLFVADTGNSLIRKITPNGVVSTFAGSAANQGYHDGNGTAAWFNSPAALAIDGAGNLYVADTGNSVIRKITATGTVTTVAGTAGSKGSVDGNGAGARFNQPSGIAVDAAGVIYVSDTFNQTIRRISASGDVSTWVGLQGVSGSADGTEMAALFNQPAGLALDASSGYLSVADTGNNVIRVISPAGSVATIAGLSGIAGLMDGIGSQAWFSQPRDTAWDSAGNLYVTDSGNAAVRKIATNGSVTTLTITASSATSTPTPPVVTPPTTTPSSSGPAPGKAGAGSTETWIVAALSVIGTLSRRRKRRSRART